MNKKIGIDLCCSPAEEAKSFTRRHVLDTMLGGGLASLIAATKINPAYAQDRETLRIGYLPITDATPLLVGWAKGYFAEAGLKVDRPELIRSWPALVEGFAAHRFNVVHMLKPIPVWMRYNNNFPVKIVAWCHTNGSALIVGRDSKIATIADCGGKSFAVPFWYSMHNVVLQMMLREVGLRPVIKTSGEEVAHDEVNLQVLPPPEMPASLAARKIDGYIVAEPFNALGELKAGGRVLRFTGDVWRDHPCCVMTMHQEDTEQRQEWTQKVVSAVVKAARFASEEREETARLLSKDGEGLLPFPFAVVNRAMNHYNVEEYRTSGAQRNAENWNNHRIDFDPWPYPSATRRIVELMKDTLVEGDKTFLSQLDPTKTSDDLVDSRFVGHAFDQGLFPSKSREREELFDL